MKITGKIEIDGVETEFLLPVDGGSTQYSQWGASTTVLGPRVELLEDLAVAAAEWAMDNLCSECKDALLDDGEGYDGRCGNCADKREKEGEEA